MKTTLQSQSKSSTSVSVLNAAVALAPVVSSEICPALAGEERLIAIASSGKKIKEYSIKEVAHKANELVTMAYFTCGFKIEKKDQQLLVMELAKELKAYFTTISFAELDIAFHNGCRKEYGEYMGLSIVTFYTWIQSYMACSERMSAKKKQREYIASLNAPPPPTATEIHVQMMKSCISMFDDFKNNIIRNSADVFDAGNAHYNFLDKLGLIEFSVEKKKELYEIAKRRLVTKNERKLVTETNTAFRAAIKEEILSFEKGNDLVKNEAKRVALETYFMELINKKKEIAAVIPVTIAELK